MGNKRFTGDEKGLNLKKFTGNAPSGYDETDSGLLVPDRKIVDPHSNSYFEHDANGDAIGGSSSMNPDNKMLPKGYVDFRIKDYLKPRKLHKKFLSGRNKPNFRVGSSLEREWYAEQVDYCLNGITHQGRYINPLYYFFLNFTQFEVPIFNSKNEFVDLDIGYPTYCNMDNYIFDIMWQAKKTGWHVSLMGGRGIGKSYIFTSPLIRGYSLMPNNKAIISGTNDKITSEAWNKFEDVLRLFEKYNPALSHKRLKDTDKVIHSGEVISDDKGSREEGYLSKVIKTVYGKDPGATRGDRPNEQLIEEFAAFPRVGQKGALKDVFAQSEGSWVIGGQIHKAFVMLSGTGGSVENDEAKDLFLDPTGYRIYPINEWGGMSGIFIPVHYKLTTTWEKTGAPETEKALELDTIERDLKQRDPVLFQNRIQEYPRTIDEVFKRKGSNIFNQTLLANQWVRLMFEENEDGAKHNKFVKRGSLVWIKDKETNVIKGTKFIEDNVGDIYITEDPELSESGSHYEDLYVMGVDSIDQGDSDSSSSVRDHSKLGAIIKKRIIEGRIVSDKDGLGASTQNIYVCYYNKRSYHVDDDFENVLKMSWHYNARINLEYTKIGILGYFTHRQQSWRFMSRPVLNRPANNNPNKITNQVGTTAADNIIKHGDGKIKEYIDSYSEEIFFIEMLDQLKAYDSTSRTKFDLVVAMNLAEVADDDLAGKAATVEEENEYQMSNDVGYYRDADGKRQYGVIPKNPTDMFINRSETVIFYDEAGVPRFDSNFSDDKRHSIITPDSNKSGSQ